MHPKSTTAVHLNSKALTNTLMLLDIRGHIRRTGSLCVICWVCGSISEPCVSSIPHTHHTTHTEPKNTHTAKHISHGWAISYLQMLSKCPRDQKKKSVQRCDSLCFYPLLFCSKDWLLHHTSSSEIFRKWFPSHFIVWCWLWNKLSECSLWLNLMNNLLKRKTLLSFLAWTGPVGYLLP